jgi:hypothetical protein
MKSVKISDAAHAALKKFCVDAGMKMQKFMDMAINKLIKENKNVKSNHKG